VKECAPFVFAFNARPACKWTLGMHLVTITERAMFFFLTTICVPLWRVLPGTIEIETFHAMLTFHRLVLWTPLTRMKEFAAAVLTLHTIFASCKTLGMNFLAVTKAAFLAVLATVCVPLWWMDLTAGQVKALYSILTRSMLLE
jgi:hypothetical protein